MPEPVSTTYTELKRRVAAGQLSPAEIAAYFEPDPERSTAFVPAARLNEKLVDTQGSRPTAKSITKLLLKAEEGLQAKPIVVGKPARSKVAGKAFKTSSAKVAVLAEGDSWFRLPDLFLFGYPKDAVDILRLTHDVKPVAFWGDEIALMVNETNKKNYLVPLNSGLWRHFIFSGGGNDVLADIKAWVKPFGSAGTNPASPGSYVKPGFAMKITETIGHYKTLYGHVRGSQEPQTPLYVHGYGYAIPKKNGPYLGGKMQQLGFDLKLDLPKLIVREMVDRFNVKLEAFANARATVTYVNLRNELGGNDWHTDEIHPNESGARKVARRLAEAMAATVPTA